MPRNWLGVQVFQGKLTYGSEEEKQSKIKRLRDFQARNLERLPAMPAKRRHPVPIGMAETMTARRLPSSYFSLLGVRQVSSSTGNAHAPIHSSRRMACTKAGADQAFGGAVSMKLGRCISFSCSLAKLG